MISTIKDILQIISDILHWLKPRSVPVFKKKQETSEQIEEDEEEVGDLTMFADKMLERLHKKKKK